jgi:hypothetical protein
MNARCVRVRLAAALVFAHGLVCAAPAQANDTNSAVTVPLNRTESVSRQFIAYTPNPLFASAVCVFAERVKQQWLSLLDTPDDWRDPIILLVRQRAPSEQPLPALRVETFQNEIHLKYQITCLLPPALDESALTAALAQTLCAEWANRRQPTLSTQPYVMAPLPPWLVQGLAQAIGGRTEWLLETARRSVDAGRPQTAADLLATARLPSDPAEQQLFQANAWLLTEGLLSLPDGARKMRRYLTELGTTKSATNAFAKVYGTDFPNDITREKWWSVEQVSRASAFVAQDLSPEETVHRLDAVLPTALMAVAGNQVKGAPWTVSLDDLWRYYEQPWMQQLLEEKLNRLQALRSEAHPLYQPVVEDYVEAVELLMGEKLNRFKRATAAANCARAAADQRTRQVADYLDQMERVYAPGDVTHSFADYFHTFDQLQSVDQNRHNPISDYLDRFDK